MEDRHLLNIQKFLSKLVRNKGEYISNRQDYLGVLACDYDARYYDKDWYMPGSAFADVEGAAEEDFNRVKVALMVISGEVRRRGLGLSELVEMPSAHYKAGNA